MAKRRGRFTPPWWLNNRHIQSCVGAIFGRNLNHFIRWEQFNLPDGDFIDLAWSGEINRPVVFILTGFEGSINSHYVGFMVRYIVDSGWQACVVHYRGCGGRINNLPRSYHVGDYDDFHQVVMRQTINNPKIPCFVVGFSMGSNVLAKYLYNFPQSPICAGCLVSCPFQVKQSVDYCGYLYQRRMINSVSKKLFEKIEAGYDMPVTPEQIKNVNHMRQLDRLVTAAFFNYKNEDEYYLYASISDDLPQIATPLLILHARDDPFIPLDTVPAADELHANSKFVLSKTGGHIGFIGGGYPWRMNFWAGKQIMRFFHNSK